MTTETLTSNRYDLTYVIDEYGRRSRRSEREIEAIILSENLQRVLDNSSLSDDEKQRLRGLSADYVIACTPLPAGTDEGNDYDETRRVMLGYLSADFPEVTKVDSTGLRRMQDDTEGVKIRVDGYSLSIEELELVYRLIRPSTEVLDRAVSDAAYFYVADRVGEVPAEASPDDPASQDPAEYDTDWYEADELPAIEESHTLRDELKPITDQLRHISSKVISIVGLRPPAASTDRSHQKIAS